MENYIMDLNFAQKAIIEKLVVANPGKTEFFPKTLVAIADENDIPRREAYNIVQSMPKVRRGVYNLSSVVLPFIQKDATPTEKARRHLVHLA